MRLRFWIVLISLFFASTQLSWAAPTTQVLVLVASAKSPLKTLTLVQARKLFLGEPLRIDGKAVVPLRNNSDPLLQEVFMQRVMFMATETYERQILNRVFRFGGQRPTVYSEQSELVEALEGDTFSVSYMWNKTAAITPSIKVIGQ